MFLSSKDQKPQVDTNQAIFDSKAFFEAIPKDRERAYAQLREQVPAHGSATPRAQELIDAGEWDNSDRFAIKCLKEGRCLGHVVGATRTGEATPLRFCGRKLSECGVMGHRASTWTEYQPGWFVPGGSKSTSGFYKAPRLPVNADGGPITQEIANALSDESHPFELTLGQWRLVIDSWWEDRVKEAGDLSSFGSPGSMGDAKSSQPGSTFSSQEDISMFNKAPGGDVKPSLESGFPAKSLSETAFPGDTEGNNLATQVQDLRDLVVTLTAKLGMVQAEQTMAHRAAATARADLDELNARYADLARKQATSQPTSVRDLEIMVEGLTKVCQEVRNTTIQLDHLVTDPTGPVEKTKDRVEKLSKQVQMGGGVDAHGIRFRDPSEIKPWLSVVADPLALFHDAVTLLHCIGASSITHKDSLTMIKAQRDAKFNSDLEARVITSFRTRLPAVFYGAGLSSASDEFVSLSTKLKSYKDWRSEDGGNTGVAERIGDGIAEVQDRVRQVSWAMTTHPEILRLCNGLLTDSVNFVNSLVAFIDRQYRELTTGTYFTQDQVWGILVATIEKIFEDMRAARAPVQDIAMEADRSALLWGILKSHAVMRRYVTNNFQNDPSIHGILVQKMLKCSPTSTVTGKVATLERSYPISQRDERLVAPRDHGVQQFDFGESLSLQLPKASVNAEATAKKQRLLVISGSSWVWLLALVQVGHEGRGIDVFPVTEIAKQNLDSLRRSNSPPLGEVTEVSTVRPSEPNRWTMVIMEDGDEVVRSATSLVSEIVGYAKRWVWIGSRSGTKLFRAGVGSEAGIYRAASHAQLGGSSKARVVIRWGPDMEGKVALGDIKYPKRPSGDWIKLSAPLEYRKRARETIIWSASSKELFPWPFPQRSDVISVPSVFYPDGSEVTRSLTSCEKAQLLDLPAHWNSDLVNAIWCWNLGAVVPLRIPVEFLLSATKWYRPEQLMVDRKGAQEASVSSAQENVLRVWADKANDLASETKFDVSQAGWLWEPGLGSEVTVATKGDSAGIDTSQWAVGGPDKEAAREAIRSWLLTRWRLGVTREALAEMRKAKDITRAQPPRRLEKVKPPLCTDPRFVGAIRECVRRSANATWWEWADGSSLFFWRWPIEWQEEAMKGAKAYHTTRPPKRLTARTVPVESEAHATLLIEKIRKLIGRRYVVPGQEDTVWCVIPFFVVPKGEFDVRVVWSDTENGVNPSIMAPTFFMPLPDTLFRRVPEDGFIGDLDVGEMFHNFPLHPTEQAYAGIRLTPEQAEALGVSTTLFVWDRLLFGWRPSPYFSVRMMTRAVEFAQGEQLDKSNPFAWDRIIFNLPGQPHYDPGKPWVMKWRTWDGVTPCEVVFFVDDGRIVGPNEYLVRQATRQVAARIQYLGIQDAARKRRPVSQRPGAWAGTVVFTDSGLPRKFVTQKKWDKAKTIVNWLDSRLKSEEGMPYRELLSYRGFLVHISLTYGFMKPFLKGLHLTIEGWRPKYQNSDLEGWPDPDYEPAGGGCTDEEDRLGPEEDTPSEVTRENDIESPKDTDQMKPAPRLKTDVAALKELFQTEKPAMIPLRPVAGRINFAYGFVDASGSGFGGTWRQVHQGDSRDVGVEARHGFWCDSVSEQSSNYREFRNLVEHVEEQATAGTLTGKEVWIFTDNMVTERVIFTGTSKAPTLFELVVRLRKLERDGQFLLRVVHVAGTRMIHEGTDGLSRGQVDVSQLTDLLASQVPLHLSARARTDKIQPWLDTWLKPNPVRLAMPEHWFSKAQKEVTDSCTGKPITWIWDLPPAAAEHALEELALARLKRHDSMQGVVLIPGLMRPHWFRRFVRTVDAYFTIPVGSRGIGNELPPWWQVSGRCNRCTRKIAFVDGIFCANFGCRVFGSRKCQSAWCASCYRMGTLVPFLVWQPKDADGLPVDIPGEENRFIEARPGDHLICPFECDDCSFQRIFRRQPQGGHPGDDTVLDFIRRINLDAFWSRAPATVEANRRAFSDQCRWADGLGFEMFDPRGPFPASYDAGMKTAMAVLHKSTQPGRHEETQKFSSARRARDIHTNMFKTSVKGIQSSIYGRVDKRRVVHGTSPVDSEFYAMFTKGFEYRVGQRVKRDMAISIEVMCQFQELSDRLWDGEDVGPLLSTWSRREIAEWTCYYLFAFCHSLRGFEVVKATLKDLRKQIGTMGGEEFLGLPLFGRFKNCGNSNERMLCFMVGRTASGLEPVKWSRRLLLILDDEAGRSDWLFQHPVSGVQRKMASFNEIFYQFLTFVQRMRPGLIPEELDVTEEYFLGRSFRRGATTRAQAAGVDKDDVEWVNRWGSGTQLIVKGPMRVIYSERTQMLETFLRFSRAL